MTSYLKSLLSSSTGLPEHRIEEDKNLENYGVDSIKSMELTDELEKTSDRYRGPYFLNIRISRV